MRVSLFLFVVGCSGASNGTTGPSGATGSTNDTGQPLPSGQPLPTGISAGTGMGHFYYTYGDDVFRIAAQSGVVAENVSTKLDAISATADPDSRINASVNGEWMTMTASRFGCTGCLVRVNKAVTAGEPIAPAGAEVFLEGLAAINATGDLVIFAASDGPHMLDLYKTTRASDGAWSAAVLLTAASAYAYNNMPALSFDGGVIAFDCGANRDPESGDNDACSIAITGGAVTRLVGTAPSPVGVMTPARNTYVQNPHFGLDGLVFEGSWPFDGREPETIWSLPPGASTPVPKSRALDNAVSPCPLRDGRTGVLWLGRTGGSGVPELTVLARDGSNPITLTLNLDVVDAGIGCSD